MLRMVLAIGALIMAGGAFAAGVDSGPTRRVGKAPVKAPPWQYAGETKGIRFWFKIANECRESGARVEMKLENTLDHDVTVAFRVVDPDWKQSFERELGSGDKDTAIRFSPDEGTACHPYVDEVYVEARGTQVTHSESGAEESPSGP